MSLTAMSLLESARRKFFMNSTYIMSRKQDSHLFGLLRLKTFDSYFLDMMYVEFMKNFLLADSCKFICVRLISAS